MHARLTIGNTTMLKSLGNFISYLSFVAGYPANIVSPKKYVKISSCQAPCKTGILKNGLAALYNSHQEFRKWVELLMCLPFLPSDRIMEMFNYLKINKLPKSESDKMRNLLK